MITPASPWIGSSRTATVSSSMASFIATGSPYAVGPGLVRNGGGGPYQVFSAFARAWREHGWSEPARTPRSPELEPAASDQRALDLLEAAVAEAPFELPGAGEDAAWRRWRRAMPASRRAGRCGWRCWYPAARPGWPAIPWPAL